MRVFHKGLILVGVPFLLAVLVIAVMFGLILQNDRERMQEARMRQLAERSSRVMVLLYDAGESLQNAFRQNQPGLKVRFKEDVIALKAEQDEIMKLDPTDQSRHTIEDLNELLENSLNSLRDILGTFTGRHMTVRSLLGTRGIQGQFAQQANALCAKSQQFVQDTLHFLETVPARQKSLFELELAVLAGGVLASIVVGLALARWFMNDIAARLQLMMDNTLRLGRNELLHPVLNGRDEIASLDRTFHSMADALTRARARERALFENASDIICVFNREDKFTAVNPACERILQFEPQDVLGASLTDYVHPDDKERTIEAIEQAKVGDPSAIIENRVRCRNGDYLEFVWSVYWSDLDEALYAVAHDITERTQLDRAKEEFLSMVSHDLRSPLSSVFGTFKLVTAKAFGAIPDAANERINECILHVNRLLGLINDLLDIEKLEAGQMQLTVEEASVDDLVSRAVTEMKSLAEAQSIQIAYEPVGIMFPFDADRMIQVLINLFSNAIKFSSVGSIVTVSVRLDDTMLEIIVGDRGRGIPVSEHDAIFERFKQVTTADGKRKSGTGLGLPICKQIAEAHGGNIHVVSGTGRGSEFVVRIPRDRKDTTGEIERPALSIMSRVRRTDRALVPTTQSGKLTSFFDNLRLMHKGAILVVVPIVFEIVFAGTFFGVLYNSYSEKLVEIHDRLISTNAANLLLCHYKMGTAMSVEDRQLGWQSFDQATQDAKASEQHLLELTRNDPARHATVTAMLQTLEPGHRFIRKAHAMIAAGGTGDENVINAFYTREKLEPTLAKAMTYVDDLYSERDPERAAMPAKIAGLRFQQSLMLAGGLLASTIICIISALLFGTGITRRLGSVEENAKRLQNDLPLNPVCAGKDEVTHLDQYFHNMAAALKEARRKERAVFDNAQDMMCAIDGDGVITRINPACEDLLQYRAEEMVGKTILQYIEDTDKQAFSAALNNVRSRNARESVETSMMRKDGIEAFLLWSLAWSQAEQTVVTIAHDVTKRKQLERLKQEFLSMVSHDLRTPLTSVQGTAEMLALDVFGALPEKAAQQMSVVERNCDRLLNLINDLLDLEKLQSGHMRFTFAEISAQQVLDQTYSALENFARQKGIQIVVEPCAETLIYADSDRLVQVGVNLLSNAIKFSPAAGVVTLSAVSSSGTVEFRISDQGRGVPASHKEAIFERYKQVQASDGKRSSGTGLGLPICKQIVEQHQGAIGVVSEEGKGSTFWFTIPSFSSKTGSDKGAASTDSMSSAV